VEECGAVSREVAVAMARGALARSRAGLAVAITGFAGPVRGEQEEGLVYIACAREGIEVIHREARFGPVGRAGVRREAIGVALDMMKEALTT
jgi:nicotinamide-nucleotide amidase